MIEDLTQIRFFRRKLGLSQKNLAEVSGVSQSLIAKIESGKLEPTYSKAKAIFEALNKEQGEVEKKAKDLMQKKILFAKSSDKVLKVVNIMKKKGISQVPIQENSRVIGIITEKGVLNAISKYGMKLSEKFAKDIMEECPPTVTINSGQRVILELLKEQQIVLVAKKGEVVGIISKSDLLLEL